LDQAHMDYGVVPLPTPNADTPPATPLGGEEMTISVSDPRTEQATWELVSWLLQPDQMLAFDRASGYIPPLKSTAAILLKSQPELNVFAGEFDSARSRTAVLGLHYQAVSETIQSAEQSAIAGVQTPAQALATAQGHVRSILR